MMQNLTTLLALLLVGIRAAGASDFYTGSALPPYWLDIASDVGVDPDRIGFNTTEGQWYIDGEPTCVTWGEWDAPCTGEYFCTGFDGSVEGYGYQQMGQLKHMIDGDFHTHNLCPVCPPSGGPGFFDICLDGTLYSFPINAMLPGDFGVPGSLAYHNRATWLACDCSEVHIGHHLTTGGYWYNMAEANGLDGSLVTHFKGVWYYNEKHSCVAMGISSTGQCDSSVFHCAGGNGATFGYAQQQMAALKSASELQTGAHADCPLR